MALVKFYRGKKASYDADTHADGIYFSTDTGEILMNDTAYGYYAGDHKEIESVDYTAPDTITIALTDGTSEVITLQTAAAGDTADESTGGLISAEDAFKLSQIEEGAQANVIESVQVNGEALDIDENKAVNIDLTGIEESIAENKVEAADSSVTITEGSTANGETIATKIAVNLKEDGGINLGDDGLELDDSATETYVGDGKAIEVDTEADSSNQKTISLKLNTNLSGNILNATTDGLYSSVQLKSLSVDDSSTLYASYGLVGIDPDGNEIEISSVTIDIPKDKYLKSVELGTIPTGQTNAGNQALIFTFNLADGSESVVYVDVSTFLTEAEAGDGITITDGVYSVAIDTTNNEVDSSGNAYLQLTSAGLKLVGINEAIAAATYDDTDLQNRVTTLEETVAVLDWEYPDSDDSSSE